MRIVRSPFEVGGENNCLAIGKWDGLHLGHRKLIENLIKKAKEISGQSVVVGFDRHPAAIFKPGSEPFQLQSIEERSVWLKELGVDVYLVLPFTKTFANYSPEYFVHNILFNQLKTKHLTVGYNFRFGKGAKGTTEVLKKLSEYHNVEVNIIPPFQSGDEIVSSTLIRNYFQKGDVEKVQLLLGYRPTIVGNLKETKNHLYELQVDHNRQALGYGQYSVYVSSSYPGTELTNDLRKDNDSIYFGKLLINQINGRKTSWLFLSDGMPKINHQKVWVQILNNKFTLSNEEEKICKQHSIVLHSATYAVNF